MSEPIITQTMSTLLIYLVSVVGSVPFRLTFGFKSLWLILDPYVKAYRFPQLLGMLVLTLTLRNLPALGLYMTHLSLSYSAFMRKVCLCVLLCLAGLSLDLEVLKKNTVPIIMLTVMPQVAEAVTIMFMCKILLGYDYLFGLAVGYIMAAVSPAVVVPGVIDLDNRKYGRKKGITTILLGASSFDDILAITIVTILLNYILPSSSSNSNVFSLFIDSEILVYVLPAIELVMSLLPGYLIGSLIGYLTISVNNKGDDNRNVVKASLCVIVPLIILVVYEFMLGIGSASYLFSISFCAILRNYWVIAESKLQIDSDPSIESDVEKLKSAKSENIEKIAFYIQNLWIFLEPLLFGLIGSLVDISLVDSSLLLYATIILFIALVFRSLGAYLSMATTELTIKERMFVAAAWVPKATVQAALSSEIYEKALSLGYTKETQWGFEVITLCIFFILVTAPIGAILISVLGPILLPYGNEGEGDLQKVDVLELKSGSGGDEDVEYI